MQCRVPVVDKTNPNSQMHVTEPHKDFLACTLAGNSAHWKNTLHVRLQRIQMAATV